MYKNNLQQLLGGNGTQKTWYCRITKTTKTINGSNDKVCNLLLIVQMVWLIKWVITPIGKMTRSISSKLNLIFIITV